MKFGGTSVEDAAAIRNLTRIVRKDLRRKPVVVVSACAGITNQLLHTAALASQGKKEEALASIAAIESRHKRIVRDLFTGETLKFLNKHFTTIGEELAALVSGVAVLGELTPRSLDTFAAYGELMSSFIIHHFFESEKIKSFWVDARSFMTTDERFTKAQVHFDATEQKLKEIVLPKLHNGYVVMTQGFIGATHHGITATIGRGGSDFSAAIIGALLHAEEIQIWTDVNGILTADQNHVVQRSGGTGLFRCTGAASRNNSSRSEKKYSRPRIELQKSGIRRHRDHGETEDGQTVYRKVDRV